MFENLRGWHILVLIIVILIILYLINRWFRSSSVTHSADEIVVQTPPMNLTQPPRYYAPEHMTKMNQSKTPFTLYNFFSPACGYSRQFVPAWNQVTDRLKDSNLITVKAIDASVPENENLMFYYNIKGYPTVLLVTPDKNIEYTGDRSAEDLYNFIMNQMKNCVSNNYTN